MGGFLLNPYIYTVAAAAASSPTIVQSNVTSSGAAVGPTPTSVITLPNVQSGNLLVVTYASAQDRQQQGFVPIWSLTSTPTYLTWTLRVQPSASAGSADVRIYTANAPTASGNVTVIISEGNATVNWGNGMAVYEISGEENTPAGATSSALLQNLPSASITTTRDNSLLLAVSSDWSAVGGTRTYRDGATETGYRLITGGAAMMFYRNVKATTGTSTQGLTAPAASGNAYGTAVLEIRTP